MEDKYSYEIVKAKNTDVPAYSGKSRELSDSSIQAMAALTSEATQLVRDTIEPVLDVVGRDIDKDMQAELKDIEGYYKERESQEAKAHEQIVNYQRLISQESEKLSKTSDPLEIEKCNDRIDKYLGGIQAILNSYDNKVEKVQKHRREESGKRNKSIFSRIFGK